MSLSKISSDVQAYSIGPFLPLDEIYEMQSSPGWFDVLMSETRKRAFEGSEEPLEVALTHNDAEMLKVTLESYPQLQSRGTIEYAYSISSPLLLRVYLEVTGELHNIILGGILYDDDMTLLEAMYSDPLLGRWIANVRDRDMETLVERQYSMDGLNTILPLLYRHGDDVPIQAILTVLYCITSGDSAGSLSYYLILEYLICNDIYRNLLKQALRDDVNMTELTHLISGIINEYRRDVGSNVVNNPGEYIYMGRFFKEKKEDIISVFEYISTRTNLCT